MLRMHEETEQNFQVEYGTVYQVKNQAHVQLVQTSLEGLLVRLDTSSQHSRTKYMSLSRPHGAQTQPDSRLLRLRYPAGGHRAGDESRLHRSPFVLEQIIAGRRRGLCADNPCFRPAPDIVPAPATPPRGTSGCQAQPETREGLVSGSPAGDRATTEGLRRSRTLS